MRWLVVTVVGAALGCAGATSQDYCPTVAATGGDVSGTWTIGPKTGSWCTAPYDRVTSGDWCSQLVVDPNGIRSLTLGHPALNFTGGTATFMADPGGTTGTYTSDLKFAANDTTVFSRACLNAYGQAPTCDDLTSDLGMWGIDTGADNASFRAAAAGSPVPDYPPGTQPQAYYNLANCVDDPASGGCACSYEVDLDAPDTGHWSTAAGVLTMYSDSSAVPYISNYGVANSQLTLSGQGGVDLLGQLGLRLMTFGK